MIPISRPLFEDEEIAAVTDVLRSGMVAQGARVAAFEERFAALCGTAHAVATSSGTTALHMALLAHGVGPGDEVITSPFSFFATASAIVMTGATPVFADIEPDTFNLCPRQAAALITDKTKAVMPVHLFGHPGDMAAFQRMAAEHGIALIEDAAQAHGAAVGDTKAGAFGTGCFSFYATKNVTAAEGGMVTTDDAGIADTLRLLRNHGMRQRYQHDILGYNFRMTDIHAAIGIAQLEKIDRFNAARAENARFLNAALENGPITRDGATHVFHQFTLRIAKGRDDVQRKLQDAGVGSGIFYPRPLYTEPPIRAHGFRGQDAFPETERACAEVLSIPVHPGLTAADLKTVAETTLRAIEDVG